LISRFGKERNAIYKYIFSFELKKVATNAQFRAIDGIATDGNFLYLREGNYQELTILKTTLGDLK
jgi:hypothetical protein